MDERRIIIKDDILFLENPTWVVSKRDTPNALTFKKEESVYEIKNSQGLPARFDKIVLYYVSHTLFKRSNLQETTVHLTRYNIAKNVLNQDKNFSKTKYDRIMAALHKWQTTTISFQGMLHGQHITRTFTIIDTVVLDEITNVLAITFNAEYIEYLRETPTYQLINFEDYKNLTRPVSARLYELLIRYVSTNESWALDITQLAELLTLEKRGYPSQIIVALKPAIQEINKNTQLKIRFAYDERRMICTFKCAPITRIPHDIYLDACAAAAL